MIISVSTIGTVVGIATPLHGYYLCVGYYQQSWVIIIDMWEIDNNRDNVDNIQRGYYTVV